MDLPGFGESDKPIGAPYDVGLVRAQRRSTRSTRSGSERALLAGNSMGGRVAIEAGLIERERVRGLVLLSPALAWLRDRRWAPLVRLLRPELGLLQLTPRPVVERRGSAARPRRRTTAGRRRAWTSSCART